MEITDIMIHSTVTHLEIEEEIITSLISSNRILGGQEEFGAERFYYTKKLFGNI